MQSYFTDNYFNDMPRTLYHSLIQTDMNASVNMTVKCSHNTPLPSPEDRTQFFYIGVYYRRALWDTMCFNAFVNLALGSRLKWQRLRIEFRNTGNKCDKCVY